VTTFINTNLLNNYIKKYTKFYLINKMPLMNAFKDYLAFYNYNLKKENILFKYQNLTIDVKFNFVIFY
jgi:hypothetical protein